MRKSAFVSSLSASSSRASGRSLLHQSAGPGRARWVSYQGTPMWIPESYLNLPQGREQPDVKRSIHQLRWTTQQPRPEVCWIEHGDLQVLQCSGANLQGQPTDNLAIRIRIVGLSRLFPSSSLPFSIEAHLLLPGRVCAYGEELLAVFPELSG